MKNYFKSTVNYLASFFTSKFLNSEPNYEFLNEDPRYAQYSIGDFSYGGPLNVENWRAAATLKIGKFCSIGPDVTVFLVGEHRTDWATTYPFYLPPFSEAFERFYGGRSVTKGNVTIGNDVWIGQGATILSGVKIGDGAVVGACSVVTRDVPPYAIVAGNPSRLIRMRFDQETVDSLLKIKWWDWDLQRIRDNMSLLLSDNMEDFIEKNLTLNS